ARRASEGWCYYFTLTWNPAALSALTSSWASKSPVTSKVSLLALAVSALTPSTFFRVALIAPLHMPQQSCTPLTVRLFTLPGLAPLSSLMARSLLPVSPWKPPAARASSAFWAAAASGAVIVTFFPAWSTSPLTPSTVLRILFTAATHMPQHRWVSFSTTVVSAREAPATTRTRPRLTNPSSFIRLSLWMRHRTPRPKGDPRPLPPAGAAGEYDYSAGRSGGSRQAGVKSSSN